MLYKMRFAASLINLFFTTYWLVITIQLKEHKLYSCCLVEIKTSAGHMFILNGMNAYTFANVMRIIILQQKLSICTVINWLK